MPNVLPKKSIIQKSEIFESGFEAITRFGIWNNYLSGTIYNKKVLKKHKLLDRLKENIEKQADYPNVYLETLVSAVSEVAYTEDILTYENCSIKPTPEAIETTSPTQTIGSIFEQFLSQRDTLHEAVSLIQKNFCHKTFYYSYVHICLKYFNTIMQPNTDIYMKNKLNQNYLKGAFFYLCLSSVAKYDQSSSYLKYLTKIIKQIRDSY
jgi:hypothetical protein